MQVMFYEKAFTSPGIQFSFNQILASLETIPFCMPFLSDWKKKTKINQKIILLYIRLLFTHFSNYLKDYLAHLLVLSN